MHSCRYLERRGAEPSEWQHVDHGQAVEMMRRILADDRAEGIKSSRACGGWREGNVNGG